MCSDITQTKKFVNANSQTLRCTAIFGAILRCNRCDIGATCHVRPEMDYRPPKVKNKPLCAQIARKMKKLSPYKTFWLICFTVGFERITNHKRERIKSVLWSGYGAVLGCSYPRSGDRKVCSSDAPNPT